MRTYDISITIHPQMPVWPGDPPIQMHRISKIEEGDSANVTNAKNNLKISYLTLAQLLELKSTEGMEIIIPDSISISEINLLSSVDDIFYEAVNKLPEIKSAEIRVESAKKGISIARGYLSPTLSFNGSWATGYSGASKEGYDPIEVLYENAGYTQNTLEPVTLVGSDYKGYNVIPFEDQLNDNQNKSLQLSLQIPIFNGWQVQTAISQAKIRKEEADLTLRQTKLDLDKKIQQAYADAVAALKNYNASEKKVNAQQEAFKYSEQKLGVGLVTAVEYNETKKNLTSAESDLLQAKYRFIYTTTVLDFYMGNPLTLNK